MAKGIVVSLKGDGREVNQDYAAYVVSEKHELWIVADGATGAKDSGQFVAVFCRELMRLLDDFQRGFESEAVRAAIASIHKKIQKEFVCAKGSFLILIIDKSKALQHCFSLGDCRVGNYLNGKIHWNTLPHNMVVAMQIFDENAICLRPERHILFRQLLGRRLDNPEYQRLSLDLLAPVIIATDGFWSHLPTTLPDQLSAQEILGYLSVKERIVDDMTVMIRLPEL
ncbi:protein phosphatase 2C domain-containing protein [Erwinia billingiae]|uniref:PP2C family protein-serine/threonine phosphatase n=1 Tax=Erwinia billingiae TaxID=182337 RepID=UPI0032090E4F